MIDWLPADWPAPDGVVAGTSLRAGGTSRGPYASLNLGAHVGDDAASVTENRRRLQAGLGLPGEPRWLRQVHGTAVVALPDAATPVEADAAVARDAGVVCAVLTADCLPVTFAVADGSAVGVAHAGWRGLSAGVLEATLASLGAAPGDVLAWLGPAISQAAFEVGGDVREQFTARDPAAAGCFVPNERGRWQADLYALARRRLNSAGVERIHGGGRCTFREDAYFYSYRRDGECGRMATIVYRR